MPCQSQAVKQTCSIEPKNYPSPILVKKGCFKDLLFNICLASTVTTLQMLWESQEKSVVYMFSKCQ